MPLVNQSSSSPDQKSQTGETVADNSAKSLKPSPLAKSISPLANFLGTASAAVGETAFFQPISTMATRLMGSEEKLPTKLLFSRPHAYLRKLKSAIFKSAADKGNAARLQSLLPGLKWGLVYKTLERTHTFVSQPYVAAWIKPYVGSGKNAEVVADAASGAVLGATQVVYLPFEALKTQAQVAALEEKTALPKPGFMQHVRTQGLGTLYKGGGTYAVRSGGSSCVFFSTLPVVKRDILGLDPSKKASTREKLAASSISSTAAVAATNPLDVVKTRIQVNAQLNAVAKKPIHPVSFWKVAKGILVKEGPAAFVKGLIPKVITVAPRITMVSTLGPILAEQVNDYLDLDQAARRFKS